MKLYNRGTTLLGIYSWEIKNYTQNLYTNIYSDFIWNSPKLETTQMLLNKWMVKWTVTHPYDGILHKNKTELIIDTGTNLVGSPEKSVKRHLSVKRQSQKVKYFMIPFI